MKVKKRILTLVLVSILSVGLFGCKKEEAVDDPYAWREDNPEHNMSDEELYESLKEIAEKSNSTLGIKLIDDDRLTVYVTGKSNGMLGAELWFEIENKKDYPVRIQSQDISVNGYMQNPIMSVDIMPGKKAKDRMIFSNISNVNDLVNIEGKLWLINNGDVSNSGTYDITIN